jgi:sulfur carrier protein
MNIYINNTPQELPEPSKITDALTALNILHQKGIAIAINNNVIPRSEWADYLLTAEDKVTLIKATQGG